MRLYDDFTARGESFLYAVPNGGARSPVEAGILAGEGVRSGVLDLVLLLPGGVSHYIEMKLPKRQSWGPGGIETRPATNPSKEQKDFMAMLDRLGFKYHVCRSQREFVEILDAAGVPWRSRPIIAADPYRA